MISNLAQALRKMYEDPDYVNVNDEKIKSYLDKSLITAEEYKYIIGEIDDE
jgi:hypothetical protein